MKIMDNVFDWKFKFKRIEYMYFFCNWFILLILNVELDVDNN